MTARVTTAVVVVLALSAGAAYAASRLASAEGTDFCVNNTNGSVRVASTCRDGEHRLTIGGGGDVRVTQNGTFTVPWGSTGTGKLLPLTGVTVSGRCETTPPEAGDIGLARIVLDAPSGQTMDVFAQDGGPNDPRGRATFLTRPLSSGGTFAGGGPLQASNGELTAIAQANAATATLTLGGYVDTAARTCVYLWQAVEAPN
jgi:hypothetical protein